MLAITTKSNTPFALIPVRSCEVADMTQSELGLTAGAQDQNGDARLEVQEVHGVRASEAQGIVTMPDDENTH